MNNKNINDTQLTKREHVTLDNNSKTSIYNCLKRITDPEAIRIARVLKNNPNTPTAKELMNALYQTIGRDVDFDEIFTQ